jgi:hypothetical protein
MITWETKTKCICCGFWCNRINFIGEGINHIDLFGVGLQEPFDLFNEFN